MLPSKFPRATVIETSPHDVVVDEKAVCLILHGEADPLLSAVVFVWMSFLCFPGNCRRNRYCTVCKKREEDDEEKEAKAMRISYCTYARRKKSPP